MSPLIDLIGSSKGYGWGALLSDGTSFESISTTILASNTSIVNITSIPSTYKHLQLRVMLRSTTAATTGGIGLRINGDGPSANNYSQHSMTGNATTASGSGSAIRDNMVIGTFAAASATGGLLGVAVIDILDYANTDKYKTIRSIAGVAGYSAGMYSGLYKSTTAISAISFRDNSDATNILAGSTIALYGIKG